MTKSNTPIDPTVLSVAAAKLRKLRLETIYGDKGCPAETVKSALDTGLARSQPGGPVEDLASPTSDAAAIALAMHPEAYRGHEQGRAKVKPAEVKRYADVFRVTAGWLSSGIGLGPAG